MANRDCQLWPEMDDDFHQNHSRIHLTCLCEKNVLSPVTLSMRGLLTICQISSCNLKRMSVCWGHLPLAKTANLSQSTPCGAASTSTDPCCDCRKPTARTLESSRICAFGGVSNPENLWRRRTGSPTSGTSWQRAIESSSEESNLVKAHSVLADLSHLSLDAAPKTRGLPWTHHRV